MAVHYLEIVSDDVDTLAGLYHRIHGLSFSPPDPDLGQARVATRADGTLVGIRKPWPRTNNRSCAVTSRSTTSNKQ